MGYIAPGVKIQYHPRLNQYMMLTDFPETQAEKDQNFNHRKYCLNISPRDKVGLVRW